MTHICSAFWNHTNIRPGNRIYPCCRFKESIAEFDGNLESVLNIKEYEDLREKNKQGVYIKGCEKCYNEESQGHKSLRQEFNEKYNVDSVELKYLEIGLDNLCSLSCDGCNSEFSTSWIKKEELIYGSSNHKSLITSNLDSIPDSVEKILFLGGEPLITDRHYDVLSLVKNTKSVDIIYNTNGMHIPTNIEKLLKFKSVKFIVSVDGYGSNNNRVREGSNWDTILDTIEWIQQNNFDIEINTVLHRNNYFTLFELSNWVRENKFNWHINCLTYPTELDIVNLANEEKDAMLAELDFVNVPNKEYIINHLNYKTIAE